MLDVRVCVHTVNGLWYPYKHTLAVRPNNYPTISLAYNIHHGVLCLLRVYALYGRSRRILGVLIFLGVGSFVTAFVGRFSLTLRLTYPCPNLKKISVKVSLFLARKAGDEAIPLEEFPPIGGCHQYIPYSGYAADPACDSPYSMIRLITLVIGVDVSHRVHVTCLLEPQGTSLCCRMDRSIYL